MGLHRHKSIQNLTSLFQRMFSPVEQDETISFVSIGPTSYEIRAEDFEDALSKAVLDHISLETTWQLRNTSPAARLGYAHNCSGAVRGAPWALIIRGEDMDRLSKLHFDVNAAMDSLNLPGGPTHPPSVNSVVMQYRPVQRFEGRLGSKVKGSCMVAVSILPAEGQDEEIDRWYRDEHLAVLATTAPFLRCTRYVQTLDPMRDSFPNSRPRMLALHEYTSSKALLEYAIQNRSGPEVTPWSKRIFATAVAVERIIWDVIGNQPQP